MKSAIIIFLSVGLMALLILVGCGRTERVEVSKVAPIGQRMIKVSFRGQQGSFRLQVNQNPIEMFRNAEFTNVVTRLRLEYGDIVVWDAQPTATGIDLGYTPDISAWWSKYLRGVRASFYAIPKDSASVFFATPIYHWKAPPVRSRPLQDAMFFMDGVPLGQSARGFLAMLTRIESAKSGQVLIFAPRINNEGQASPWIAEGQLLTWAADAGVRSRFEKILFGRYCKFTDFARFEDEE